jgi:hypothetical protein
MIAPTATGRDLACRKTWSASCLREPTREAFGSTRAALPPGAAGPSWPPSRVACTAATVLMWQQAKLRFRYVPVALRGKGCVHGVSSFPRPCAAKTTVAPKISRVFPINQKRKIESTCPIPRFLCMASKGTQNNPKKHPPVVGPCCFCLPERHHPDYNHAGRKDRDLQRRLEVRRPEDLTPPIVACMLTRALFWLHV